MRLGISSYTYTWAIGVPGHAPARPMTATDLVARAADLGVGVVQIADNLPLERMAEDELAAVEREARRRGVAIEVGTRGIGRDHLRRFLELAERFGSPIVRTVIDAGPHRPSEDEVVEILRGAIGEFERAAVTLAIENHDRFPAAAFARIVERIGSERVGICLDTVNSFGALEGPEAVISTLAPLTVNLHVKDFAIRRVESQMGFLIEGRPAGEGRLDIPRLLETLRGHGRDPNAILELWTPPEPELADTIAKEAEWAASSVARLREWVPG